MDNCLSDYGARCSNGESLVAVADDGIRCYAMLFHIQAGELRLADFNSRFNRGHVSKKFATGLKDRAAASRELTELTAAEFMPDDALPNSLTHSRSGRRPIVFGLSSRLTALAAIEFCARQEGSSSPEIRAAIKSLTNGRRDTPIPIEDEAIAERICDGVSRYLQIIGEELGRAYAASQVNKMHFETIRASLSNPWRARNGTFSPTAKKFESLFGVISAELPEHVSEFLPDGQNRPGSERLLAEVTNGARKGTTKLLDELPNVIGHARRQNRPDALSIRGYDNGSGQTYLPLQAPNPR